MRREKERKRCKRMKEKMRCGAQKIPKTMTPTDNQMLVGDTLLSTKYSHIRIITATNLFRAL